MSIVNYPHLILLISSQMFEVTVTLKTKRVELFSTVNSATQLEAVVGQGILPLPTEWDMTSQHHHWPFRTVLVMQSVDRIWNGTESFL